MGHLGTVSLQHQAAAAAAAAAVEEEEEVASMPASQLADPVRVVAADFV